MPHVLQVHPSDDAIVALQDLACGAAVSWGTGSVTLHERIPMKQKFASHDFAVGELITMYGVTVGKATQAISQGSLLHTGNVVHATSSYRGKQRDNVWTPPDITPWRGRTFNGYRRPQGPAGTANFWIVIPLVFCENRNLAFIREALTRSLGYHQTTPYEQFAQHLVDLHRNGATSAQIAAAEFAQSSSRHTARVFDKIDGVKFLEHGLGCGGTRQDAQALCRLLAGYIHHPNVAGATILSLGCQHAQVSMLEQELAAFAPSLKKPLLIYEQQKSKSERDMMGAAIRDTFSHLAIANEQTREPCPLADIVLAVECGGSDGFSGISANPAVGHTADILAALGGTPVLSEFPELCGVEQSLCDRCVTSELADKFVRLMRAYEDAARACGSGFDANPSPGNIRDGLITDGIKSAGAAKKGGTSPILDVLDYGEPIRARGGLTLYCTPGNDVESTTALAGGGCTMMLFTTGLGTPTGNPICPTLKVATHSDLARRMPDLIDYDTDPIISGEKSVERCGEELLDLVIATASGEYLPKATLLGQDDFLPWKRGVSL